MESKLTNAMLKSRLGELVADRLAAAGEAEAARHEGFSGTADRVAEDNPELAKFMIAAGDLWNEIRDSGRENQLADELDIEQYDALRGVADA